MGHQEPPKDFNQRYCDDYNGKKDGDGESWLDQLFGMSDMALVCQESILLMSTALAVAALC